MKRYIIATSQSDWKTCRHTLSLRNGTDIENYCYERNLNDQYLASIVPKYSNDYSNTQWEVTIYDRIFPKESRIFDTVEEAKKFADTELYNKYCV